MWEKGRGLGRRKGEAIKRYSLYDFTESQEKILLEKRQQTSVSAVGVDKART
jgi:hypothetical protein